MKLLSRNWWPYFKELTQTGSYPFTRPTAQSWWRRRCRITPRDLVRTLTNTLLLQNNPWLALLLDLELTTETTNVWRVLQRRPNDTELLGSPPQAADRSQSKTYVGLHAMNTLTNFVQASPIQYYFRSPPWRSVTLSGDWEISWTRHWPDPITPTCQWKFSTGSFESRTPSCTWSDWQLAIIW